MKRYNKRGQFFILAAVIISAVVISLGVANNKAISNNDPDGFEDFTYEIKKETGAVMDYEIYTDFSTGDDLGKFVRLLAKDIRDKDTNANFMFIYGNNSNLTVRNYGSEDAYLEGELVEGGGGVVLNSICLGRTCQDIETFVDTNREAVIYYDEGDLGSNETFSGNVWGVDYEFPLTEHRQVIFLIQKKVNEDNYVSIK